MYLLFPANQPQSWENRLRDELFQTYGLPLIDARTWVADDDCENGYHTLLHGAEDFTSRLCDELPRLLEQTTAGRSDCQR